MEKYIARGVVIILTLSILLALFSVPVASDNALVNLPIITIETIESTLTPEVNTTRPSIVPEATEPTEEELITVDIYYSAPTTSDNCLEMIKNCESAIEFLYQYSDNANFENELARVSQIREQYELDYSELLAQEAEKAKWAASEEEHPEATYIWLFMKNEFGWSDTVCAGIMGNMMAEVAGGTLEYLSRWDMNEPGGYGLIQWIGQRRIDIRAKYGSAPSIDEQLYFMRDEMYGTNGVRKQITDEQLDAIMNAETPEEVAYNFARYFERCASYSYNPRRGYARIAYDYFVD